MKTLCVAVVLLSLTSVCQPAPLACEKLLKPVDSTPDISGRWHVIAWSSDSCLATTLVNSVLWPSVKIDFTSLGTPNLFNMTIEGKMHGYCESSSEEMLYVNNSMFEVDSTNAPTGKPTVLLQSSCPDCMLLKDDEDDLLSTFFLLSRRKSVADDELKEFESQVGCLGWAKMQVFNTDHEYQGCPSTDDISDNNGLSKMIYARVKTTYLEPLKCILESFAASPSSAIEWIQELFT
ncbi:uncharacterized protein LOC131968423 [Centropristis striata]|uniref:uncharacterized protein LOC131968423 n=1 Tax=Centropristis striata TaxID=184440 RepID=UPI0027E14705|nr:uncharacterized protein LOC131968423 [Centropristis striata]